MILLLLNSCIIGFVIALTYYSIEKKIKLNIKNRFFVLMSYSIICWVLGYYSLAIYPDDWLRTESIDESICFDKQGKYDCIEAQPAAHDAEPGETE